MTTILRDFSLNLEKIDKFSRSREGELADLRSLLDKCISPHFDPKHSNLYRGTRWNSSLDQFAGSVRWISLDFEVLIDLWTLALPTLIVSNGSIQIRESKWYFVNNILDIYPAERYRQVSRQVYWFWNRTESYRVNRIKLMVRSRPYKVDLTESYRADGTEHDLIVILSKRRAGSWSVDVHWNRKKRMSIRKDNLVNKWKFINQTQWSKLSDCFFSLRSSRFEYSMAKLRYSPEDKPPGPPGQIDL